MTDKSALLIGASVVARPRTTPTFALVVALCVAAILASPAPASALVIKMELPDLVHSADSIVVAHVSGQSHHIGGPLAFARPKIYTDSRLRVERVLSGSRPSDITLSQLGGTFAGSTLVVSDLPKISAGQRFILFLDVHGDVVGGYQGKLDIVKGRVPQLGLSLAEAISAIQAGGVVPAVKSSTSGLTSSGSGSVAVSGITATSISAITPPNANAGIGERVYITGAGFGTTTGTALFTDGITGLTDVPATIVSWSDTGIVCTVPSGTDGVESGNVTVTRADAVGSATQYYSVGFSTTGLRWQSSSVSYLVNPNCPGVGSTAALADVRAAMATWNVSGTSFRYNNSGTTALAAQTDTSDGLNEIFWSDGFPDSGFLAWNVTWYDPATSVISESDVVFNNSPAGYLWFDGASSNTIDVRSVALHELGHTLQINDQYSNTWKVMGALQLGTARRVLTQSEIDGARYFNDWPTTPAVNSSTDPIQGTWYASTTAVLNFSAAGPATVNGYSYVIDGSPVTVPDTTAEGSGTSYTQSGLTTGEHWFHVRARTSLGFWGLTSHYRLRIDATAPTGTVRIADPATSTVTSRLVPIDATLVDAQSGLNDMRVDAGSGWSGWTPYASHVTTMLPVTDGTHDVSVEYRDKVGNSRLVTRTLMLSTTATGSVVESSSMSLSAPATLKYAATATLSGTLNGAVSGPLAGRSVSLEAMPYGSAAFGFVGSTVTVASGAYSFTVKPAVKTIYRVRFAGDATHIPTLSSQRSVLPSAWVSTPVAPTTVSRAKYYTVYGYLKPRHAPGTSVVRVYRWRWNGTSWVLIVLVNPKASNYWTS